MPRNGRGGRATRTRHFRRLALRVKVDRTTRGLTRITERKGGERYPLYRVVNFEGACNNDKTRRGSLAEPGKAISLSLSLSFWKYAFFNYFFLAQLSFLNTIYRNFVDYYNIILFISYYNIWIILLYIISNRLDIYLRILDLIYMYNITSNIRICLICWYMYNKKLSLLLNFHFFLHFLKEMVNLNYTNKKPYVLDKLCLKYWQRERKRERE